MNKEEKPELIPNISMLLNTALLRLLLLLFIDLQTAICTYRTSLSMRSIHTFNSHLRDETKQSAYSKANKIPVCVILVNPFLDSNIGSAARAMLNYEITDLRLVNPQCDHNSKDAHALAVGAYEILENARVYTSVEESISDLQCIYATSGRERDSDRQQLTAEEAAQEIVMRPNAQNVSVGFLFGREKGGLRKEEVSLAQAVVSIPTYESFPVLNLAQSVNVIGYELFKQRRALTYGALRERKIDADELATRLEVDILLREIESNFSLTKPESDRDDLKNFQKLRDIVYGKSVSKSELGVFYKIIRSYDTKTRGSQKS